MFLSGAAFAVLWIVIAVVRPAVSFKALKRASKLFRQPGTRHVPWPLHVAFQSWVIGLTTQGCAQGVQPHRWAPWHLMPPAASHRHVCLCPTGHPHALHVAPQTLHASAPHPSHTDTPTVPYRTDAVTPQVCSFLFLTRRVRRGPDGEELQEPGGARRGRPGRLARGRPFLIRGRRGKGAVDSDGGYQQLVSTHPAAVQKGTFSGA